MCLYPVPTAAFDSKVGLKVWDASGCTMVHYCVNIPDRVGSTPTTRAFSVRSGKTVFLYAGTIHI
jgi:hypothetical protein